MRGFTLAEILIVLGIVIFLLATGLVLGIDTLKSYSRRSERDTLVTIFAKARSRAMNNMWQTPHGVCVDGTDYIIFRGQFYTPGDTTNESIPGNSAVSISGLPDCASGSGIVFSQIAGTTSGSVIILTQAGQVSTVELNEEGRIN